MILKAFFVWFIIGSINQFRQRLISKTDRITAFLVILGEMYFYFRILNLIWR